MIMVHCLNLMQSSREQTRVS